MDRVEPMTRKRTDSNHAEVLNHYRQLGFSVIDLSQQPGCLDGLVGKFGLTDWIEIKDGKKPPSAQRLTPKEGEIFETWKGRQPRLIRSTQDVDQHQADLWRESLGR